MNKYFSVILFLVIFPIVALANFNNVGPEVVVRGEVLNHSSLPIYLIKLQLDPTQDGSISFDYDDQNAKKGYYNLYAIQGDAFSTRVYISIMDSAGGGLDKRQCQITYIIHNNGQLETQLLQLENSALHCEIDAVGNIDLSSILSTKH